VAIRLGFKAVHYSEVKADDVTEGGAEGTRIRWLITKGDGAEHFAMRYFEMAPGGHSPHHSHPWEHEVFILEGACLVACGDQKRNVDAGSAVFIPPNVVHHFKNEGKGTLRFLCVVPHHE
jgi:quercetin dioxygenase-like cupin family protein